MTKIENLNVQFYFAMSVKTPTRSPLRSATKNLDSASKKLMILQREYKLNKADLERLSEENEALEKECNELKIKKSKLSHTLKAEKKIISYKVDEIKQDFSVKTAIENEKAKMEIAGIMEQKKQERVETVNKLKLMIQETGESFTSNIQGMKEELQNFKVWNSKQETAEMIQKAYDNRSLSETELLNVSLKKTIQDLHPETIKMPVKAELSISNESVSFEEEGESYYEPKTAESHITYTRYVVVKPKFLTNNM